MPTFSVTVHETIRRVATITIRANSQDEAEEQGEQRVLDGQIEWSAEEREEIEVVSEEETQ